MFSNHHQPSTPRTTSRRAQSMTQIGVMAAVLCLLGPLALPIGPVPLSLGTFGVMLCACLLSTKKAALTCLLYLFLGTAGLPVFTGFSGGLGKLAGPTGGYLVGYLFLAVIGGWFVHHFPGKLRFHFLGMLLGLMVCYTLGTLWLAFVTHMGPDAALAAGVLPFLPFDLLKAVAAVFLGREARTRLQKAGILTDAN